MATVRIRGPVFYSAGDELSYYRWATKIPCITKIEYESSEIIYHFRSRRISDSCLRELLALFRRYNLKMTQLAQFKSDGNKAWFASPESYWFARVFKD